MDFGLSGEQQQLKDSAREFLNGECSTAEVRKAMASEDGRLQTEADWKVVSTQVRRGASIGSGAVIMGGVTIGEGALVGAGAVVTHDVPANTIAKGVPARLGRAVPQK